MDIIKALRAEEIRLTKELSAVQRAIRVLGNAGADQRHDNRSKRVFSAATRARMSRKARQRWSRWRDQRAKKAA